MDFFLYPDEFPEKEIDSFLDRLEHLSTCVMRHYGAQSENVKG